MNGAELLAYRELAKQYRWKADNIVRFFDGLGMTTEQKQKFLASELAGAYMQGELNLLTRHTEADGAR